MSKRLSPIERLARDICWIGFVNPKLAGTTKITYWNRLPETTRTKYRDEAKRFAFLLERVPLDTLNAVHDRQTT